MLALLGGKPVRTKPFPAHITTAGDDKKAIARVLKNGLLSGFEGSNNQFFLGGPEVKAFEREWADYFKVKYAISFNSATSGLMAAVGATGAGPGDEIITTPWTMTATATAILVYNAVPIFCDIEPDTFCMSPVSLEKKITPRTKAIMPVHIYGHPAPMDEILAIARKHSVYVIEDAAQTPKTRYKGKYTGTIGDMGVFSLNANKIIQTGEGGVVTTDNDDLAQRLRLIRNHAEAVIATGMKTTSLVNMIGWNYRMNEIEAAIGRVQLKKLTGLLTRRKELVEYLNKKLSACEGLMLPTVKDGCEHSYYRYPLRLDPTKVKIKAVRIVEALNAEGMDFSTGYVPLNTFPLYQKQIGYGDKGCPFKCPFYEGAPDYSMSGFPEIQGALDRSFSTEVIRPPLTFKDIDGIAAAFKKVWKNLNTL